MTSISETELNLYKKLIKKTERYLLLFWKPEDNLKQNLKKKLKRDLYFVYIMVGKTQKLAYKDRNTDKYYKVDEHYKKTLIEWKKCIFLRVCRPMDL